LNFIKRKRFWGLLLAAGLLVYCFYDFDFHSVLAALSSLNIRYLIPLIFLEVIIAFVRTLRLKIIIDPIKRIGATHLYPIFCIGMMTNLLMPYLTGQVARLYIISNRTQLRKTFVFTTTVLEVLFDGMALLGIVLLISLFIVIPSQFEPWHFVVLGVVVLAVLVFLFALSRSHGKSHDFLSRFTIHLPPATKKKIDDIKHSFLSGLQFLRSTRHLFVVSTLSLLSWVVQAAMVYLLVLAFRFSISLWGAVIITAVVTIMMTVVLSPWNIGTFQGATVAAMQPFGIIKPEALAFSFMLHIFVYLPPIILGAFFSFKEGLTFRELKDEGKKGVEDIEVEDTVASGDEKAKAK
jgi:uncharacterized protein (TIRG00374 family)